MLLTNKNVLKLADLGMAKVLRKAAGRTYIGSPEYMSPEVEECEGCTKEEGKTYSFKTDVWLGLYYCFLFAYSSTIYNTINIIKVARMCPL